MFKQSGKPAPFMWMCLLNVVCVLSLPASAKNKGFVTIATLGPSPVTVSANTRPQQVVNRVIGHWHSQFARVLPEAPDLIVVQKACFPEN